MIIHGKALSKIIISYEVGFTNPTTIFPKLGSFYPFSILAKIQTLSAVKPKIVPKQRKKDNSKDK